MYIYVGQEYQIGLQCIIKKKFILAPNKFTYKYSIGI